MTTHEIERPVPRPAQPFNRRLKAQGHTLPPTGPMRVPSRRHLLRQDVIGVGLTLLVFFAIFYGVTREFVGPLLVIGGVALVMTVAPALLRRRGRARRR